MEDLKEITTRLDIIQKCIDEIDTKLTTIYNYINNPEPDNEDTDDMVESYDDI